MAMKKDITRRVFIMGTTASVLAGCAGSGTRRVTTRRVSPNEKLNIAAIGSGGKGQADTNGCRSENLVALCDVDFNRAAETFNRWPDAPRYKDFREMLDKEPSIDACTVTTPDHMHYCAAKYAMEMGKHVYVQKPLTHTIVEARKLTELAEKTGLVTQMGNQGHSGDGVRGLAEMLWSGAIGQVSEVHIWTNRPVWPQGIGRPAGSDPVPDHFDWDLWLGAMPERPFVSKHPDTKRDCYHPFVWRGWWDFGCGALGDMACHIMDPAFYTMNLLYPDSVELIMQEGMTDETGPNKSVIKFHFPERKAPEGASYSKMSAVDIYWYDGGVRPERPAAIPDDVRLGDGANGSLFVGESGYLTTGEYGGDSRLVGPGAEDYKAPDPWIERVPGEDHYKNWINAIKNDDQACSNFKYAGPFTEMVLLGNAAIRAEKKLMWNAKRLRFTNDEAANDLLHIEYRDGWEL